MTHIHLQPLPHLADLPGTPWLAPPLSSHPHDPDTVALLVGYLGSATQFYYWMEYSEDLIGGKFQVAGGSSAVSDGTYYWRLDAVEYLQHYPITVPDDALEHFARQGWVPPHMNEVEHNSVQRALNRIFGIYSLG